MRGEVVSKKKIREEDKKMRTKYRIEEDENKI